MAVAVKNAPEAAPRGLWNRLPVATLLGVVYVLAGLAVVFALVPRLWQAAVADWLVRWTGEFVNATLLGLVLIAVAAGFVYVGARLVGPQPLPGLRAGVGVGLVAVLLIGLLLRWFGGLMERWTYEGRLFGEAGRLGGIAVTVLVGLVLLAAVGRLFLKPGFTRWLIAAESQGWFSTTTYKRSQGQRVRRGTILGILILTGAGIFTLTQGNRLAGVGDWAINIPFTGRAVIESANDARVVLDQRFPDGWETVTFDRYTLRDINDDLLRNYVKVTVPGIRGELEAGQVVSREAFDKVVAAQQQEIDRLLQQAKEAEDAGRPLEARTRREEAESLRKGMPQAGEPTPATATVTYHQLTLLPAVRFTLPLLLAACSLWLAWRVVNVPTFADFLIATEAEMNKVSWTSRRRLFQDTIVVLTCVVLLTIFLLVADLIWANLLRGIGVLRFGASPVEVQKEAQKARSSW
ncbi:MAG TPA: preprotein translocase subunit SecE [Gemmataceae bacterium]|nr:preprotein translocase subunit SecE [Gemmataceae bacterium]